MKRREFIAALGSAAAWPVVARGQLERYRRVAILWAGGPTDGGRSLTVFREELAVHGWIEGKNTKIEVHPTGGDADVYRSKASLLAEDPPDVIVVSSNPGLLAVMKATATIPVVFWPLVARAQQQGRMYRLGFLIPSGRKPPWVLAFLDELRLNGFIEGQNLAIIPAGFDVQVDLLAERAEAMVKAEPDAIVGGPEPQLRALQAKTGTIPLIGMTNDMVADGLVKSLARPGGNTTGISLLSPELDGKRQDILMEAVPGARRIAALADSNVTPTHIQALQDTARLRGIELLVFAVAKPEDIAPAVDAAKRQEPKHSIF